jgi:hypothetical protein
VIPLLLETSSRDESVRVWSAGCASGEEAYTIAMLAEAMGEDAFKRRVQIHATDIDEDALNSARHATFSRSDVKAVPPELLQRYFESGRASANGFTFRSDLPGDLRPQRPRAGRADLPDRPPDLAQHADVSHGGDAVAHPRGTSTSRSTTPASSSSASRRC